MDLLVLSTNHRWNQIPSQVGKLLLELFPENLRWLGDSQPEAQPQRTEEQKAVLAASFALGRDAQVPHVAAPQWAVVDLPSGYSAIRLSFRNETRHYDGQPENAQKAFQQEIPAEVLAAYKKAWRPRK